MSETAVRVCPRGHRWTPPADTPFDADTPCPLCSGVELPVPPPPVTAPRPSLPHVPGYELLDELGRGGMGVVYRARHLALNRIVALKMIQVRPTSGPEELAALLLRFKREAEQAKLEPEERLEQTRQGLREVVGRISEDLRLQQPGTEPLRKDMAEKALRQVEDYQRLLREDAGADNAEELARTQRWRALLTWVARSPEQAVPILTQAIAAQERLWRARPEDAARCQELALGYSSLGFIHGQGGRHAEAMTALRRTCDLLEPLATEDRASPSGLATLAGAWNNRGLYASRAGGRAEARSAFLRAQTLWTKLSAAHPDDPLPRAGLAAVHVNLANLCVQADDLEGARGLYHKALAEQQRLLREHPGTQAFATALTLTYHLLAYHLTLTYHLRDAKGMRNDTDLTPLRGRDDFQKLLAEVERRERSARK
jgi:tetratricopeptide (TPR) repeat protein